MNKGYLFLTLSLLCTTAYPIREIIKAPGRAVKAVVDPDPEPVYERRQKPVYKKDVVIGEELGEYAGTIEDTDKKVYIRSARNGKKYGIVDNGRTMKNVNITCVKKGMMGVPNISVPEYIGKYKAKNGDTCYVFKRNLIGGEGKERQLIGREGEERELIGRKGKERRLIGEDE